MSRLQEQREIRSLAMKFWAGLVLTIPVLFLAMGEYIPGLHLSTLIPMRVSNWLELALSTPVILWAGAMFFARGWRSFTGHRLLG
jgi:Cu+-exporting ATPase